MTFSTYVDMYLKCQQYKDLPKFVEKSMSERWEVICVQSDRTEKQVSFVNAICTVRGGEHVYYI